MNEAELIRLDPAALAAYLWKRLRSEEPMDPPLRGRFRDEEPEAFVLEVLRGNESAEFPQKLIEAMQTNLQDLLSHQAGRWQQCWANNVFNEQLASLAYLAVEAGQVKDVDARDLAWALRELVNPWAMGVGPRPEHWFLGQVQAVRALTWLQDANRGLWGTFWRKLWDACPLDMLGIVIFGFARAEMEAAMEHFGQLVDVRDRIDMPNVLLTLVEPPGPGPAAVGKAAERLPKPDVDLLLADLDKGGATWEQMLEYAKIAQPSEPAVEKHMLGRLPSMIGKKRGCRQDLRQALLAISSEVLHKDTELQEIHRWFIRLAHEHGWERWAVDSLPRLAVRSPDGSWLLWVPYVTCLRLMNTIKIELLETYCDQAVERVRLILRADLVAPTAKALQAVDDTRVRNPWSGDQTMADFVKQFAQPAIDAFSRWVQELSTEALPPRQKMSVAAESCRREMAAFCDQA